MEVLALPQGAQLGGSSCLASVTHKVGHLAAQLRWRLEEAFPHSYGHLMLPVLWVSVPRGASWVMLAASYWSLLAPAVEMATSSGGFGSFAFFPVAVGFTLGAAFVYLADLLMPHLGAAEDPPTALALNFTPASLKKSDTEGPRLLFPESELSIRIDKSENGEAYQRKKTVATGLPEGPAAPAPPRGNPVQPGSGSWRRIALLILAITIHNIPDPSLTRVSRWPRLCLCRRPGGKRKADPQELDTRSHEDTAIRTDKRKRARVRDLCPALPLHAAFMQHPVPVLGIRVSASGVVRGFCLGWGGWGGRFPVQCTPLMHVLSISFGMGPLFGRWNDKPSCASKSSVSHSSPFLGSGYGACLLKKKEKWNLRKRYS
ncbi:zinc transporter ZIP11 isoform X2 [Mustela putorius furo]|uniref:Zinc transporter ZIP11 isoform X2 n=1 Tax=Mustela putorius furo TaxID=9669 RepID=A0A8U0SFJ0_MUSPF|nr:zinc transporter ZIP11 isoform X2 [Mustela putorius furo]